MALKLNISTKRLQIDKANTTMVTAVAISSFIFVFSLFAIKALASQRSYQQRVITKKEHARDQLKTNVNNSKTLVTAYQSFVQQPQNIIGGNSDGITGRDGDNAKIILDALPSKYDFPAMTNSINAMLNSAHVKVTGQSGIDEEIAQDQNNASPSPVAVTMPFEATVSGDYNSVKSVFDIFELSIRPISVQSLTFTGSDKQLTVDIKAQTYYQPARSLTINTEIVK